MDAQVRRTWGGLRSRSETGFRVPLRGSVRVPLNLKGIHKGLGFRDQGYLIYKPVRLGFRVLKHPTLPGFLKLEALKPKLFFNNRAPKSSNFPIQS